MSRLISSTIEDMSASSCWLRTLESDRRGSTLVEFAFIVGPLIALIIAILQVTLTFFAQQNLETAGQRAVRRLMTGSAQNGGMTQADFKKLVCSGLPSFMKCANVMVDVRAAAAFSSANTAAPTITYNGAGQPNNSWTYNPGEPGQITVVQIMYIWDVATGPLKLDLSNLSSGKRLLRSVSVFKTEQYR